MGQSESSPFSNTNNIKRILENDQWQGILNGNEFDGLVDIYLNSEELQNPFKHKYIVKINSEIPYNCLMAILFPNHPNQKKRILWTTGYLNSLSKEINQRLSESSRDGLQLAVTAGEKIYRFYNIIGPVYLFWASRINIQTLNREENSILNDIPILIETNGQWSTRSVFIFGNTSATKLTDFQPLEPIQTILYCCESDPRKENIQIINTLTELKADELTKDLVVRTLVDMKQEQIPFADNLDMIPCTERFTNYNITDPEEPDERLNLEEVQSFI